jgi:hypothetical protein
MSQPPPNIEPTLSLHHTSGPAFIAAWIQYLPDPMAQHPHGAISEFAHHPTSMARVESQGPFVGETKLDAWLFKHSRFLRAHFKNAMQHTDASGTVFQHPSSGMVDGPEQRVRSETTGSKVSGSQQQQQQQEEEERHGEREDHDDVDEIQVGEEAPGHAVTRVQDVNLNLQKGGKLRRGSVRRGMRWAFWYSGDE